MDKFSKYNKKKLEDWGTAMSDEAKSFYRAFKNYLKREFPDATLVGFRPNHYDFSGFIVQDGKCVYISHDLYRACDGYAYADFSDSSCMNGVLYRTARDTKDFRGGGNRFSSIYDLAENVRQMFSSYDSFSVRAA